MSTVLFVLATQRASLEPWLSDVRRELAGRLPLRVAQGEADFEDVETVIDVGGWAPNELVDLGAEAGVRLWQVLGYGLDHIDVGHVLGRGLLLAHTPGSASAIPLAEHAMHLMLSVEKRAVECRRNVESGRFSQPTLGELAGQTLLIVGFGASGRELAARASSFAMRVLAVDIERPESALLEDAFAIGELDIALPQADIVSLHLPLLPETRHLVDRRRLMLFKPSAVLINVARGALVDEVALAHALSIGELRAAGLDVFESEPPEHDNPLLHLSNVVLTPHVAGMTEATSRRRATIAVENALRVDRGEVPAHQVTTAQEVPQPG